LRAAGVALLNYIMCIAVGKRVLLRIGNAAPRFNANLPNLMMSETGKDSPIYALPCCAWTLNIALLLLCNTYNGFSYIPFASWSGAAGASSHESFCLNYEP
jgi:hypothetical protein